MYGVAGERRLEEYGSSGLRATKLPARPDRQCGAEQLQLDVYGEVIDALTSARRPGFMATASWGLNGR